MSFLRDRSLGNKGEELVQKIFQGHGFKTELNSDRSKFADFDIKALFKEQELLLEAKYDLYCARSGNIAIEFFNPKQGKASGIGSTKSDLWAHVITDPLSVWLAPVSCLRQYTSTTKPHKLVSCGGDDNSSMYLYKKDVIFGAIFTRVDECGKDDFIKTISELLERGKLC